MTSRDWRHRTHADADQTRRARWNDDVNKFTSTLHSSDIDKLQLAVHDRVLDWTSLWAHYSENKQRRLKFSAHVTRQRARDQLANLLLGHDRRTVLFIGDQASKTGYHGHPAYPVTALRDHLAHVGIVVLVDEYRTSATCSNCGAFLHMADYKHPVCDQCDVVWQRDVNAARNIKSVVDNYIAGKRRPSHLRKHWRESA